MQELSYNTISTTIELWERVKRKQDYTQIGGAKLLHRLFEKSPEARVLFGFDKEINLNSPEVLASPKFLKHAAHLVEMMDCALNMLGPDIDLLDEIVGELAAKHKRYGVTPAMFPMLGEAYTYTFESMLGKNEFGPKERAAWAETYEMFSGSMVKAMKN